jgi:hypothetical protein
MQSQVNPVSCISTEYFSDEREDATGQTSPTKGCLFVETSAKEIGFRFGYFLAIVNVHAQFGHISQKMRKEKFSAVTPNEFLSGLKVAKEFHLFHHLLLPIIEAIIITRHNNLLKNLVDSPRLKLGTYGLKARCDTVSP